MDSPYDAIVRSATETSSPKRTSHDDLIDFYSKKNGVDPELTRRVVGQESGGQQTAVSPKGAAGLMQLMPETARGLGVTDLFDPHQNLDAGTRYLKQQMDEFGSPELALAAYNAGPGAVRKHGNKIPPYAETQNYVKTILKGYRPRPQPTDQVADAYDSIVRTAVEPLTKRQQAQVAMQKSVPIDQSTTDSYDTPLTSEEEARFKSWKQKYAPRDSGDDYDLRGAFKAGLTPDPKTGHWPDTFKKPNHPTFSNQSKYAVGADAVKAGRWEGQKFIPPTSGLTDIEQRLAQGDVAGAAVIARGKALDREAAKPQPPAVEAPFVEPVVGEARPRDLEFGGMTPAERTAYGQEQQKYSQIDTVGNIAYARLAQQRIDAARQRQAEERRRQARAAMETSAARHPNQEGLLLPAGQKNAGPAYQPTFGGGQPYRDIPKIDRSVTSTAQLLAPPPTTGMSFEQDRAARSAATEAARPLQGMGDLRRYEEQQGKNEAQVKSSIRAQVLTEEAQREAAAASGSEAQLLAQRARQEGMNPPDIEERVEERYQSYLRSIAPEMFEQRQVYGQLSPAARSIAAPVARSIGGLLKTAGGITGLGGVTPNDLSRWANARGSFVEESATLPPLNEKGEAIVRGLPEQSVAAVTDLGLSIAQLVVLKKVTKLPMGVLMALETTLQTTDTPVKDRAKQVAQSYAMGTILDQHLGRVASAALFGAEPGLQNYAAYKEGQMSGEDALLQTGIQAGAGFILGGKGPKELPIKVAEVGARAEVTPEWLRTRLAKTGGVGQVILVEDLPSGSPGLALTKYGEQQAGPNANVGRVLSVYGDPKSEGIGGVELSGPEAVESYAKRGVQIVKVSPAEYDQALARINAVNPTPPTEIGAPAPSQPLIAEASAKRAPQQRSAEEVRAVDTAREQREAAERQAVTEGLPDLPDVNKTQALSALEKATRANDQIAVEQLTQLARQRGASDTEINEVLRPKQPQVGLLAGQRVSYGDQKGTVTKIRDSTAYVDFDNGGGRSDLWSQFTPEEPAMPPTPATPRVEEKPGTLVAQFESMMEGRGNRKATILPANTPSAVTAATAPLPPGVDRVIASNGNVVVFKSSAIDKSEVKDLLRTGRANELTGLPNPEGLEATLVGVARVAEGPNKGEERFSGYLVPGNEDKFRKEAIAQFPNETLSFEFGGAKTEKKVIEQRTSPAPLRDEEQHPPAVTSETPPTSATHPGAAEVAASTPKQLPDKAAQPDLRPETTAPSSIVTKEDLDREIASFNTKGYGEWDMFTGRVPAKDNPSTLALENAGIREGDRVNFFAERPRSGTVQRDQSGELRVVDSKGATWGIQGILRERDGYIRQVPTTKPTVTPPAEVKTQSTATESQPTTPKEVTDAVAEPSRRSEALKPTSSEAPGQVTVPDKSVDKTEAKEPSALRSTDVKQGKERRVARSIVDDNRRKLWGPGQVNRREVERPDAYEVFTPERRAEIQQKIAEAQPEDVDNMKRMLVGAKERISAADTDQITTPVREYKKKEPVQAEISNKPFTWKTKNGQTMQAEAGDWKVIHPNGRIGSVKPDIFKTSYEPVEGREGWYKKTVPTKAQQLDRPVEVETPEGKSRGKAGDYLVTGEKGEKYIVTKQEFEGLYRPEEKPEEPLVTREPPKHHDYVDFPPEMDSLGIRRAAMPQIKSEHRGALANRLKARGIDYSFEEVLPGELRPSQAEYSPAKVEKARGWTGPERKLLVSSDSLVLDGHHQWMAKLADAPETPIPIIRLHAPAQEALLELAQFPSSDVQGTHGENEPDMKDAEAPTTAGQSATSPETKEKSENVHSERHVTRAEGSNADRQGKEEGPTEEKGEEETAVEGISQQNEVKEADRAQTVRGNQEELSTRRQVGGRGAEPGGRDLHQERETGESVKPSEKPASRPTKEKPTVAPVPEGKELSADDIASMVDEAVADVAKQEKGEAAADVTTTLAEWATRLRQIVGGLRGKTPIGERRQQLEQLLNEGRNYRDQAGVHDNAKFNEAIDSLAEALGIPQAEEKPVEKTPAKASRSRRPKPSEPERWSVIGKNSQGEDVYEDPNGVRALSSSGVLVTESVMLTPTRAGIQTSYSHKGEYLLASEVAEKPVSVETPKEAVPAPKAEEAIYDRSLAAYKRLAPAMAEKVLIGNAERLTDIIEKKKPFDPNGMLREANKVSRTVFTEITGVKLGATDKSAREAIEAWKAPDEPAETLDEQFQNIKDLADEASRELAAVEAELPTPAPTKPSLASATKALGDIFDEEEEEPVGTAQFSRMEPEFDEAKYAMAEPQFIIALQSFQDEGLTLAQSIPRLVKYLNTEAGYSAPKIARMKPYVVRFVLNVQAGKVNLSEKQAEATPPPAPSPSAPSGIDTLAQAVTERLGKIVGTGTGMNNAHLRDMAERAFGGTIAQGTYTVKDAYDALELGVNKYLLERAPDMLADDPQKALRDLRTVMSALPRQTDRTTETDQLQQFSTPPTLAFIAAKALNIQPSDIVEEPSAGTGNLALWAKAAGAAVETNEISPRRRKILEAMGFSPTSVDAELLNDLLPLNIRPTAVLMNPPFSATGGRTASNDTKYGARHIEQALLRLEEDGRAVIITGEGMAIGKHKFSDWWKRMMTRYNVRANLSIPGDEYGKYGTTFGTQLLVIDKTGPTPGTSPSEQLKNVRFGDVTSLEVALNELAPIIADRPALKSDATRSLVAADRGDVRGDLGEPTPTPDRGGELSGSGRSGPIAGEDGPSGPSESDTGVLKSKPGTRPTKPQRPRPVRSGSRGLEDVRLTDGLSGTAEPDFVPTDLGLVYSRRTEKRETEEGGTFVSYSPAKLAGAMVHPADIVESASMAAVEPPDITHVPQLPTAVVTEGKLSDLQLESVSYAGQRFKQRLPSGARAGYFIGDGTGVGKGREVSGIILDEWNQGNRRALWLSVSRDLIEDASRDLKDIGAAHLPLASVSDFPPADDITLPKGVIFSTYNSLISAAKTGSKQKRREQIEKWLGEDGVIILDEAHKAKNALGQGQSEPTQTGQAVIDLQANLPNARVVYASATGATDVRNMAYMTRLGLWGPGTSFPGGFIEFMGEIDRGGVGAMEMVSRDMKALGMYASRSISFNGVDYQETIHELAAEQRHIYDTAANAMQVVLQNINEALGITNASKRAKMMAMQRFWADHQRLFRQLISSFKVPTVIRQTEKALAEGKSVVIGLIGTGESRTKEQVTKALSVGGNLEDLDFSPREFIANMIDKAFPVNVYQEVTDEETGQTTLELVRDEEGNPVVSQEALRLKEAMLDQLSDLHLPENPLDQIVNYFGEKQVAEMTGRKRRLMRGPDGKMAYKKRAPDGVAMTRVNVHENKQFQAGKKRIAIISDAAATGISLHASNREENKQRRVHMTLELGWSADKQMQTFGRTHRSDQSTPPEYDLISTDIGGEKRFSSTIARRLASLGALTKGQRDATGGGDLAKYNFETEEGKAALTRFYSNIMSGQSIEGVENPRQALKDMGILKERTDGESISDDDMVDVPRFLNRILALDLNRQNVLFNQFTTIFEQTIDFAKENGTFDEGVADVKGESIRMKGEPSVVHRDQTTGAETTHYLLDVDTKTEPVGWERAKKVANFHTNSGFYKQKRSGNIIVADEAASHTDPATGFVFKTYAVTTPLQERDHFIRDNELSEKYSKIKEADAKPWWLEAFNKVPPIRTTETHVIGGAILPLWQRLKTDEGARLKVVRVMTDDGQRVVGIQIPNKQVASVLRSIGVGRELKTPEEVFTAVLDQDDVVKLVGGLVLAKARLHNDDAIEVRGADYNKFDQLRQMGLINERIDWKQRFFVPTNMETGVPALRMLLGSYPVIDMRSEATPPPESEPQFSEGPRGWETAEAGPEEEPEFSIEGNHISLNNAARALMSDAYGLTRFKDRMPPNGIGGAYEKAPGALAEALDMLAAQQPERAEGAKALAAAVREVGKQGPVSLAFGEKQRRHEGVHRVSHEASGEAAVDERHTAAGFKRLEAHPAWPTIQDSLLRKEYPHSLPVLAEEAFAYLATGDNLGLTDEEADSWMEAWLRSFKEKNGSPAVAKFKELSDAAEQARQRIYAGGETVDRRAGGSVPGVPDEGAEGAPGTHEEGARGEPWQKPRAASGLTENEHRLAVALAINTGKDVPAAVLREYPGLAESIHFDQAQFAGPPLQTDTEAFEQWFGNSKVVDKNGDPLVVYHRSPFKFTAFDKREIIHFGFHFGTLRQARAVNMGGARGNLYQGYLKIENPLRLPDLGSWDTDSIVEELRKRRLITDEQDNDLDTAFNPEQQLWEIIKSHGYDGIVYENLGEREFKDKKNDILADSYIVPEPTQFKSTKNKGTFDPDNPSMLFAEHEDPWARLLKLAEDIQRPEGQESRRLPKTFEAAEMETGTSLFFTPTTVPTGIEMGKQTVAEKGVDGAIEFVKTGDGIGWASTGYEVLAQLRADEQRIRPTDAQAADAIADKRLKFLDEFVERSTELGRAIVGIKAIEMFAPDRAAYHLNKLSQRRRKHGISKEEEAEITRIALELARVNDELKAAQAQIDYRIEVARSLEEDLAAAEARARRREKYESGAGKERQPRAAQQYEVELNEQAADIKDDLIARLGSLDFGNLKIESRFPGQAGKIGDIKALPGDAELLAQYTASQLATHDTVADLNKHLLDTFGPEVEPYLSAIRQRAWQIRKDARLAELANRETSETRSRTIIAEIQKEIAAGAKAVKDLERAHVAAEKERQKAEKDAAKEAEQSARRAERAEVKAGEKELREEARKQAKATRQQQREARLAEIKEARARLKATRKEYQEASEAETKGWRATNKAQREAARTAGYWDTPIRRAAEEARARLVTATDVSDPLVMEDLAAVAAEKFLDKPGGPVRKKAVNPSKVRLELIDEFPNLVTKKNLDEIYRRGYQRILDMEAAAREAARLRTANKESQQLWEKLGVDTDAQALLVQRATKRRQQQELRHKMTEDFERVSRSRAANFFFELNAFPRSAKSSIDAPELRQGMFPFLTHPQAMLRTITAAGKGYAAIHPADYHALVEELQRMPRYELAKMAGMDLPEIIGDVSDPRVHSEEYFQSGWGQKVPHIRVSEQAYVLSMNTKRMTLFNLLAPAGEAHGYTWENNPEFFKQVASFINDVTGRGNVPESMARFMSTWLNWFFFAPRYNVSKIQLLNDLFNPLKYISAEWAPATPGLKQLSGVVKELQGGLPGSTAYDPIMRKIAAEHVLRWLGALLALLLAAKLLGFSITFDLNDADAFPKIRWGNTSYDLSGGEIGTVRFVYRFLKGIAKLTAGWPVSDREHPATIAGQFFRQKLSPWTGGFVDWISETDAVGQPATIKTPVGWYKQGAVKTLQEDILVKMIEPIVVGDFLDGATDSGWLGVGRTLPALLGLGVQTYSRKDKPSATQSLIYEKLAEQREQTPQEKERTQLMRKLEEDIRQGKPVTTQIEAAVKEGKLRPDDRVEIAKAAQLTPTQLAFKQLSITAAMDVYADRSLSAEDKAALKDLLISKGSTIENLPEPEQDAAEARFEALTGEKPKTRRQQRRESGRKRSPRWYDELKRSENASPSPTP